MKTRTPGEIIVEQRGRIDTINALLQEASSTEVRRGLRESRRDAERIIRETRKAS